MNSARRPPRGKYASQKPGVDNKIKVHVRQLQCLCEKFRIFIIRQSDKQINLSISVFVRVRDDDVYICLYLFVPYQSQRHTNINFVPI